MDWGWVATGGESQIELVVWLVCSRGGRGSRTHAHGTEWGGCTLVGTAPVPELPFPSPSSSSEQEEEEEEADENSQALLLPIKQARNQSNPTTQVKKRKSEKRTSIIHHPSSSSPSVLPRIRFVPTSSATPTELRRRSSQRHRVLLLLVRRT